MKQTLCPCGTTKSYSECCGRIHLLAKSATHPEQLMRARYSAHAMGKLDFIAASWHPTHRPADMTAVKTWNDSCTWLALNVANSRRLGKTGSVEFVALYRQAGKLQQHHEIAQFVLEKGQWWYWSRD